MKIAIIGAGVSGLTAAYRLAQSGHQVTIFEKGDIPGGLASGFKADHWNWPLEFHYHHIFNSDSAIKNLAQEINCTPFFQSPRSSILYNNQIYPFDGPFQIIKFPHLSLLSKFRLASSLVFLKIWPKWQILESTTTSKWIIRYMGEESWKKIWGPLLVGKFGSYYEQISAVWFWARVHARTKQLGYFPGGFQSFINKLAQAIEKKGVTIKYNSQVQSISSNSSQQIVINESGKKTTFDKCLVAAPGVVLNKLTKLPTSYQQQITSLKGLGAITLVVSLKQSFFTDGTYWLNINQKAPFLAVVEHTNFISPDKYGGDHILYIGNYLPADHPYFKLTPTQLLTKFTPELKHINPQFNKKNVKHTWVFKTPFAQPIVPINYASKIPDMKTPIPNLWWVSMQHVYPWDRGTNFAVEWGEKAAQSMMSE